jgi:hypothetical protein
LLAAGVLLGASACVAHSCPNSDSSEDVARWSAELRARQPLELDDNATLSIKRDVRDVVVDIDASHLADAFQRVLRDPARRFGLIRVDRLPENAGKPFALGEKFQGRYVIEAAGRAQLRGKAEDWFGDFASSKPVQQFLCDVENRHTSDFGVLTELVTSPPPGEAYVMQYVYLAGSPIAGSSTFTISDVTDPKLLAKYSVAQAARITQVFEYQEREGDFANFFTRGGLRLHDQVVFSQAEQSASLAGAHILETNIPVAYQSF